MNFIHWTNKFHPRRTPQVGSASGILVSFAWLVFSKCVGKWPAYRHWLVPPIPANLWPQLAIAISEILMSTFGLIEYQDASPEVRAVYDDIMVRAKPIGSIISGKPSRMIPPY